MSSASSAARLALTSLCTTGTTVSLKVSTPTMRYVEFLVQIFVSVFGRCK